MMSIENSTFLKNWSTTTEKMNGTFSAKGVGLTASANFEADDGILNGTEFQLSLDLNLKIDNVNISVSTIVDNVDESDFTELDNVTACFSGPENCHSLDQLTFEQAIVLATVAKEVSVFANNIEVKTVKIEGDASSLLSKFYKDEAFEIKFTVKAHAASNLKIDIELHGNTSRNEINKLDDNDGEIFDGDILNGLTHFTGQICIGTECANFKECSDNLCNHHQERNTKKSTNATTETTKANNATTDITEPTNTTTEITKPTNATTEITKAKNATIDVTKPSNETTEITKHNITSPNTTKVVFSCNL